MDLYEELRSTGFLTKDQCFEVVKLVEKNFTDAQQLKAEIAAKKKPQSRYQSDYEQGCISGYNDAIDDILRQLSAV